MVFYETKLVHLQCFPFFKGGAPRWSNVHWIILFIIMNHYHDIHESLLIATFNLKLPVNVALTLLNCYAKPNTRKSKCLHAWDFWSFNLHDDEFCLSSSVISWITDEHIKDCCKDKNSLCEVQSIESSSRNRTNRQKV